MYICRKSDNIHPMTNFSISILLIALSFQSFAQLSFSADTVVVNMNPGTSVQATIQVSNPGTHPVNISSTTIFSTTQDFGNPNGTWNISWCNCNNCYTNEFSVIPTSDSCLDPMNPGTSMAWYMEIDPIVPTYVDGMWSVEIFNYTDNIKDTITYIFKGQTPPSSQLGVSSHNPTAQNSTGRIQVASTQITNTYTQDIQLDWNIINSNLMDFGNPNGSWQLEFSTGDTTINNSQNTLAQTGTANPIISSGASATWSLELNPDTLDIINAFCTMEIINVTNQAKDTVTFIFNDSNYDPQSINSPYKKTQVNFYPNPVKDNLHIKYSVNDVNSKLFVYNITGTRIHTESINSINGELTINVQNFPPGLYYFSIESDQGIKDVYKFIVQ